MERRPRSGWWGEEVDGWRAAAWTVIGRGGVGANGTEGGRAGVSHRIIQRRVRGESGRWRGRSMFARISSDDRDVGTDLARRPCADNNTGLRPKQVHLPHMAAASQSISRSQMAPRMDLRSETGAFGCLRVFRDVPLV